MTQDEYDRASACAAHYELPWHAEGLSAEREAWAACRAVQIDVQKSDDKAPQAAQAAVPVAGQSRFIGDVWGSCSVEHVAMVLAAPNEWKGYEVRYLYATPAHPAEGVPAAAEGRTESEIVDRTEAAARFLLRWKYGLEPESSDAQLRHSGNAKAQWAWDAACRLQEIMTDSDAVNAVQEVDDAQEVVSTPAAPAAPAADALTHAELLEIKRAIQDFEECGETDVSYKLLMRGADAGYLECAHFTPLRDSRLDAAIDAARAAQGESHD